MPSVSARAASRVSWQTERVDRFNRADWLVIDELGMGTIDTDFEPLDLFEHRRWSGRVDIVRDGNTFSSWRSVNHSRWRPVSPWHNCSKP